MNREERDVNHTVNRLHLLIQESRLCYDRAQNALSELLDRVADGGIVTVAEAEKALTVSSGCVTQMQDHDERFRSTARELSTASTNTLIFLFGRLNHLNRLRNRSLELVRVPVTTILEEGKVTPVEACSYYDEEYRLSQRMLPPLLSIYDTLFSLRPVGELL